MPALTPRQVHEQFTEAFKAHDLDALIVRDAVITIYFAAFADFKESDSGYDKIGKNGSGLFGERTTVQKESADLQKAN